MNEICEIKDRDESINQLIYDANKTIQKDYYKDIDNIKICPYEKKDFLYENNLRLIKIEKIVFEENDNILSKLSNVYSSIISNEGSLILIIDTNKVSIDFYLGVKSVNNNYPIGNIKDTLLKTLEGNFPGLKSEEPYINDIRNLMKKVDSKDIISVVSGISDLKEEQGKFEQGMEKLIESMKGEEYTALFIADSLSETELDNMENGYQQMYSILSAYAEQNITIGTTEGINISDSETESITDTIAESISNTSGTTKGVNIGVNKGKSIAKSISGVATPLGLSISIAKTVTSMINSSLGVSYSKNESETKAKTKSNSKQTGNSHTEGISTSKSNSTQINIINKPVKSLLEKIDAQLERIKTSKNYGFWQTGVYFLADSYKVSRSAADTFASLMKGKSSCLEKSIVHTWSDTNKNHGEIKKYLKDFQHPIFKLNDINCNFNKLEFKVTSLISTKELALQFGLPRKSVPGLTCIQSAEFGRNIIKYSNEKEKKINIGKIYHLGRKELQNIEITTNSLSKHTLVTGSTGTGKSNLIYKMLFELDKQHINFLVIEPAKGEYKEIFGGRGDVNVFGTNIQHTKLLKLNPFKFPEGIHILEHVDRLIEILNAVWPMYSAMPAILKEAVEESYIKNGWDLDNSINLNTIKTYPTFYDLTEVLPDIISKSSYSDEVKGNYSGALVTRVKSLTNGLIGKIFGYDDTDNKVLFEENTIIDLSRVGSLETKALLMGIIFLKLQEYRMNNSKGVNLDLHHVTVLEEAHNLLRKTSFGQSQEGSNLQGKSVEMISNSIAEMRTYGEGFIIVDQTPNLLDESAIKNTNTKIVLRLPSMDDRNNVGTAMNLNEKQIMELARLETGVAAIYQNDWECGVLGKIDYFNQKCPYSYTYNLKEEVKKDRSRKTKILKLLLFNRVSENKRIDYKTMNLSGVEKVIKNLNIGSNIRIKLLENLEQLRNNDTMDLWNDEYYSELSSIICELLNIRDLVMEIKNLQEVNGLILKEITNKLILEDDNEYLLAIIQSILRIESMKSGMNKKIYFSWVEGIRKGEIKL